MRIALGIEYDGSAFRGWQTQPGDRTVQDALEAALARIAGVPINLVCAGRTDAGVHATGQVAHFDSPVQRPLTAYRYILLNRAQRPGVGQGRIGWDHHPLDVAKMQQAAELIRGEHDFSAFRAAQCQAKTPVKTMREVSIRRLGELIVFEFEASAFLHHMVRNLVGSLVYIGQGRKPVAWMSELLAMKDRKLSAPTFSAAGLYLVGVRYETRWGLPETDDTMPLGLEGVLRG